MCLTCSRANDFAQCVASLARKDIQTDTHAPANAAAGTTVAFLGASGLTDDTTICSQVLSYQRMTQPAGF
jgi:hypothetical protein